MSVIFNSLKAHGSCSLALTGFCVIIYNPSNRKEKEAPVTTQLPLPRSADELTSWAQAEPFIQDLLARTITPATLDVWLADWTRLARLVQETY